jgi:hypothetical protein
MEESSPREGPPTDPSPKNRGRYGEVLGDSTVFRLGGAPVELGLGATLVEGHRAPLVPGELSAPPGLWAVCALALSSQC